MSVETGLDNELALLVNSLARASISIEDVSTEQPLTNPIEDKSSKTPLASWDTSVVRSHSGI